MEQTNDQWLWFVDNELVEALARTDVLDADERKAAGAVLDARQSAGSQHGRQDRAGVARDPGAPSMAARICRNWLWTKAHLEFQLGQFENALEDYQKLLETQPNHKGANYNAALCLEKLKRYEEAAGAFRKAAESGSETGRRRLLGVGVSELHCNRPEDALASFEECLQGAARPTATPCMAKP